MGLQRRDLQRHVGKDLCTSGQLDFEDGLPRTTKPDTVYHGFGLKSIRMLVEQYEGNVKIVTEGNRFILDILFPV